MKWSMAFAALVMSMSVLLSRFMGLIRDKVISWQFGTGMEADLYFMAFTIPDFINYLLAGGYLSISLIPFLSRKFEEEDDGQAWHFFSTVFTWASIAIIALTSLAFVFSPSLVPYIAPGFNAEAHMRLTYFLRIILFAQVFFLLGACFSALLYVRKQFAVPALMPLIYNASILFFGISLPALGVVEGMEGFCYGVLIGAFIGAFLLPYFAVKKHELKLYFTLKDKDFKAFLFLALPLMLGQSVVILDEQFIRIFGSMAGEGAVSLLNYARRIMLVPVGLVAQAAAVASFPFLANLYAQKNFEEFENTLAKALHSALVLIVPITAFMIIQSANILGLIFEGGVFSPEDTLKAEPLLQIMLLAVPFWTLQQMIGRAFYAKQNTLTPTLIGTFASVCIIPLYAYFVPKYGAVLVASLTTFSLLLYTGLLLFVYDRKRAFALTSKVGITFLRSSLLTIPAAFFSFYCTIKLESLIFMQEWSPLLKQISQITLSGLVFSLFWLFFAWKLEKSYVLLILSPFQKILAKIRRK